MTRLLLVVIDKGPEEGAVLQIKLGKGQKINKKQQKKPLPSWVFLWGAAGRADEIESMFQRQDSWGARYTLWPLQEPQGCGCTTRQRLWGKGKGSGTG